MKHPAWRWSALLTALVVLGAAPAADPYDLVRQGNVAFARGKYQAAHDAYEAAGGRIPDPGLTAFNKAAALYQLEEFREAELHYRYCLEDAVGPRRARALFGLGTALLRQYPERGADVLREALGAYAACLKEQDLDPDLAGDARHNRELAKLLLAQAPPPEKGPTERTPQGGNQEKKGRHEKKSGDPQIARTQQGTERPDPRKMGTPVQPEAGQDPIRTDQQPPGGAGLPPLPDQARLSSLSAHDAEAHLEQAVDRIGRDRRAQRYRTIRAPAGAMDR